MQTETETEIEKVEYLTPCENIVKHMLATGEMQIVGKKIVLAAAVEEKVRQEYITFLKRFFDENVAEDAKEIEDSISGEEWDWYYNTKWVKLGIKKVYTRMRKIIIHKIRRTDMKKIMIVILMLTVMAGCKLKPVDDTTTTTTTTSKYYSTSTTTIEYDDEDTTTSSTTTTIEDCMQNWWCTIEGSRWGIYSDYDIQCVDGRLILFFACYESYTTGEYTLEDGTIVPWLTVDDGSRVGYKNVNDNKPDSCFVCAQTFKFPDDTGYNLHICDNIQQDIDNANLCAE